MGSHVIDKLEAWGPTRCEEVSSEDAKAYCRELTLGQYENFSVLSRFVPQRMRSGVCAVYAFCRWADDLADESGSRESALEHLAWWRSELDACFNGQPRQPVFIALNAARSQYDLASTPFHDLITAFERDQRQQRWESWDELLGYCRGSADPVGRLVLSLAGVGDDPALVAASDSICSGLQLVNHWQDVRRDVLERGRIYIPLDLMPGADFESRLVTTAQQGHAPDQQFLAKYRELMSELLDRTEPMFDPITLLLEGVPRDARPMIWLFAAGGRSVLDSIRRSDCETVLFRPRLSPMRKLTLLWKARGQR